MNTCPNPNSPEWKALVKALGEGNAMTAYTENGNNIPSVEQARSILSTMKVLEKDEQLSRSSDAFKLQRAKEQMTALSLMDLQARPKQKATLEALKAMNLRYQEFLRNNIRLKAEGKPGINTVSVSNLIGSSEFKGDPKEYEAFKLFGTFMHEILEAGQVEALRRASRIDQVMTREFFDEILETYRKKNPFYIENLDEQAMFDMAQGIIRNIPLDKGYMILPEITITGETKDGSLVVGRMDLILIDMQGRVNIFDFKTKKVTRMMEFDTATDSYQPNEDLVFVDLAEKRFPVDPKKGTADAFKGQQRTTYDTWTLQLKVYENILKQNGIPTKDQSILAMIYQTDKDKKFVGHAIHVFDEDNFYNYAAGADVVNNNGFWVTEPDTATKIVQGLRDTIDEEIPTEESKAKQKAEEKKEAKLLDFQPTEQQDENLLSAIKESVESDLQDVLKKIRENDNTTEDPALREILATRRETLRRFQDILNKVAPDDPAVGYSANYSSALDAVQVDMLDMVKSVRDAMKTIKFDGKFSAEAKQIREAYHRSRAIKSVVDVLRQIAQENNIYSENPLTNESETMKRFIDIDFGMAEIESSFANIGKYAVMEVLKLPGEKVYSDISEQEKEPLMARIKKIEREIEKLEANQPLGILDGIKRISLSFVSPEFKKRLADRLGDDAALLPTLEAKQRELMRLKDKLDGGLTYSEEAFERYVNGITDPNSNLYIGSGNPYVGDSFLAGFNTNSLIASASNSDPLIATFTMLYKNAEASARMAIQNSFAAMQFDRQRDALLKQYSVEELNDMVSETRTYKYTNPNTGAVEERSQLYYVIPYSEEYGNTYREFFTKRRELENQIRDAKIKRNELFKTPEGPAAEEAYMQLVKEKESLIKQQMQWQLDNCHLPYNDNWYRLQLAMPEEIRNELQMKYLEIETITYQVGRGNEILLTEEDFNRIKEIEDEIRVLRDKAKEMNPEYAKYIEEFNSMYEFDTNTAFYERMRNNARDRFQVEHPELWEKWKKDNEVTRPTARPELPETLEFGQRVMYNNEIHVVIEAREGGAVKIAGPEAWANEDDSLTEVVMRKDLQSLNWYEELADLADRRASILKQDPDVSQLYEERKAILRPHKDGGKIQPQFLTDDEVSRLDAIDAQLEEIYEKKGKSKQIFTEWQIEELRAIKQRSNKLKKMEISEAYLETFNSKHTALLRAHREMIEAQARAERAEFNNDPKDVIEKARTEEQLATADFATYEKEFEAWYNKFHNNKYRSILTGWNAATEKDPKSFNYESTPSDGVREQYMETLPHPKYKIKRLKESAYNPNFLKSPDGIPMPKAIQQTTEGHYVITPGMETSANVNQKYKALMNKPDVMSFYNSMMKMHFDLQKRVEGTKIGYKVPGFAASTIENIVNKGMLGSLNSEWQKFLDKSLKVSSFQDVSNNTFGDMSEKLRHRFTEQLPEHLQTKDAIGAMMKYATEAHFNIAMQDVAPKADTIIDYLDLQMSKLQEDIKTNKRFESVDPVTGKRTPVNMEDRRKQLENVISILKFERRKHAYGQAEDPNAANRKLTKQVNTVLAYTSFVRIGFDVANQAKNYISGNVQAFIGAGGLASDQYTRGDYMWAKKKVYGPDGFLANYFKDWGRVDDISESTLLYRFFNPAQKDFIKYTTEITGSKSRRIKNKLSNVSELGFLLQDKGDTEIAVSVMYAVMNHKRYRVFELDANGEKVYKKNADGTDMTVPVHEIYYKNSLGQLARRNDVEYSVEDENRVRNTIYSEMRRAQGNYAKADQTKLEETILGKLVMFFRKYLVPQLLNRFGFLRPNWEAGEVALGYWRAVAEAWKYYGPGEVAKHFLVGSKRLSKMNKNQMGDFYTRKVAQARRDAMVMAIFAMLGMMALTYVRRKDEDDEELSFLEGNAIRILWGVKGETLSMFPVGGGSQEYIKNFTTGIPLVREFTALQKAGGHAWNYSLAMIMNGGEEPDPMFDSEYYQEVWKDAFYTRKQGAYEKGDAKINKDLMDLTGLKNFRNLYNPNYTIDQLKRNQ